MGKPYALLAVLWGAVIFAGSVMRYAPAPFVLFPQEDKLLHFTEFAILSLLIYKAFIHACEIRIARKAIVGTLLIGLSYGMLLEANQCRLAHRECGAPDLLANWGGVVALALFAFYKGCLRERRIRGRQLAGRPAAG